MMTRPSHSIVLANSTSCRPRFYGMPSPSQTLKRLCILHVPSTRKRMSKSVRKSMRSSKRGKFTPDQRLKMTQGSWCNTKFFLLFTFTLYLFIILSIIHKLFKLPKLLLYTGKYIFASCFIFAPFALVVCVRI